MSNIDGGGIVGSFNQAHAASKLAQAEKSRNQSSAEVGSREARRKFEVAREEVLQTETLHGNRVESDQRQQDPRGGPQRKRPRPLNPAAAPAEPAALTDSPAGGDSEPHRGKVIDIRA